MCTVENNRTVSNTTKLMKILFYSWEFGPGAGGIGQYLYQMAKGLSSLGHQCIIVTGSEHAHLLYEGDFVGKVYRIYNKSEVRTQEIAARVLEIAKDNKVDFIEGTDHWGECQRVIYAKDRPPVLIKLHSCQYLRKIEQVSSFYWWQKLLIKMARFRMYSQICAERYCIENADAVIAPSQKIFSEYYNQGTRLPSQRALVPNILYEIPEINVLVDNLRPTILFSGRLEILKGIQYLPGILRDVSREIPNVVLEIAGDDQCARGIGSLKKWLEKQFGPNVSSVKFLGKLSADQMAEAYRRSYLLIFPSKWDNFPMSVLEAMAHGKPVVTTHNGGMQEMLIGTGATIAEPDSVEFYQSIIALLNDANLRREIGDACRNRVINCYTPRQVLPEYLNFIETCI